MAQLLAPFVSIHVVGLPDPYCLLTSLAALSDSRWTICLILVVLAFNALMLLVGWQEKTELLGIDTHCTTPQSVYRFRFTSLPTSTSTYRQCTAPESVYRPSVYIPTYSLPLIPSQLHTPKLLNCHPTLLGTGQRSCQVSVLLYWRDFGLFILPSSATRLHRANGIAPFVLQCRQL